MGTPLPRPGDPLSPQPLPPGFEPPTSRKAIASLICGIFFFLPTSIGAVLLGHLAHSEIRKSAGRLKGKGLATTGLVLGYLGLACLPFVLLILAAIAIPNLLRSRLAANEAAAVGALRTFHTGASSYASQCPDIGFPASAASLGPGSGDCSHANLVDQSLSLPRAEKSGYIFIYQPMIHDRQGRINKYAISADPRQPGISGVRHFYTDETGIIRFETDNGATAVSTPL